VERYTRHWPGRFSAHICPLAVPPAEHRTLNGNWRRNLVVVMDLTSPLQWQRCRRSGRPDSELELEKSGRSRRLEWIGSGALNAIDFSAQGQLHATVSVSDDGIPDSVQYMQFKPIYFKVSVAFCMVECSSFKLEQINGLCFVNWL